MEAEWKDRSGTPPHAYGLAGISSRAGSRRACLYAGAMVLAAGLAVLRADVTPGLPASLADLLNCAAIGIPLMTWLMLSCHGAAFGDLGISRLASAFLFLAAIQVATFIGLALPLGAAVVEWRELAPWARLSGLLGFAAIVAAHGLGGWHEERSAGQVPGFGAVIRLAALVLGTAALLAVALRFGAPQWSSLSLDARAGQPASGNWPAIGFSLTVLVTIAAALATRMVCTSQRTVVDVWLMVVLIGAGVDVLTGLSWRDPSSLGWHAGRVIEIAANAAMLCAVLDSSARLYHEQARANRTLGRLALLDSLTGLGNRRDLDAELDRAWKRAVREAAWLSVIFIDVDDFKQYNDLYGHGAGDACLRGVAAILQRHRCRPDDVACRYGGDEFVLLLYSADPVGAQEIATSIRTGVEAANLPHAASRIGRVMVSTGVASVRPAGVDSTAEDLLRSSDDALYRSKRAGRNAARLALGAPAMAGIGS